MTTSKILAPCLALLSLSAMADEQRVYRVDPYGNVQYGKPSYSVGGDGGVVEVDATGTSNHRRPSTP